jgi:hypothetical protein
MGLIGGMARTAVVAGTATAVSNRVSRRQAGRWAEQDAPPQVPAQPEYAAAPPPPPAADDKFEQLEKLGQLKASGILTEGEFQAEKARLLR